MATTATSNIVCDNSTLANFKSWCQTISAAISSFGWVASSDTGQVVWSSIAAVPSSAYVFEIWKAADALAVTAPIFLKLEYGYSSTSPSLKITVGGGSDGTGNLTGGVVGPYIVTGGGTGSLGNQGSTIYTCYFSGHAGEFRAMLWQNNTTSTACCIFGIERSKDNSGADTNEYVTVLGAYNYYGDWLQQTIVGSSVTAREATILTFASSSSPQTQNFLGNTAAVPVFPLLGKVGNPMLGFYCGAGADVAEGATVSVNCYGANHTYVATKQGQIGTRLGFLSTHGGALLMRYE